jgi:hypothetical protein
LSEFQQALLIFVVGAVVTGCTVGMIVQGHLHWRRQEQKR